jgi:hypothetical protein
VHGDHVVPVVDPEQEVALDLLPRHAVLSQPNASYFCLKPGNGWSAEAYTRAAEEAGVGVTPLSPFAASSLHPSGAVRICVNAAPDQEMLRGALETLAGLLEAGTPPSVRFRAAVRSQGPPHRSWRDGAGWHPDRIPNKKHPRSRCSQGVADLAASLIGLGMRRPTRWLLLDGGER